MQPTSSAALTGSRLFIFVAACCLATMLEGIGLQSPGLTMPALGAVFHMTPEDKGNFASMSTWGLMIGAALGGRLSDLIGRKWVLIGSVAVFGLMTLLTVLCTSIPMLEGARLLTGLGFGGALPNVLSLVSESVDPKKRNMAMGFLYAGLPTGGATASLIVYFASAHEQWPIVYLVGGIASLVLTPVLSLILPKTAAAPKNTAAKPSVGIMFALFGEDRALRTIALWLGFFLALLTLYLLLNWLPSLMIGRGLPGRNASQVQIAFNIFGAIGSVITGYALDRGKRGFTVAGVFAVSLAAIAYLAAVPAEVVLAIIAGGLVGATVSGTQTVLYSLAPACYPTAIRGTGVGAAVAIGRFGSALGTVLVGVLIGHGRTPTEVLTYLLPILAVSGVAAVYATVSAEPKPAPAPIPAV